MAGHHGPYVAETGITDYLLSLYLGELDQFRFSEVQTMPESGAGSELVITLRFPKVAQEDRAWPQLCSCDDFGWHVKGRAEPLVHDVPIGSVHVQLKAGHRSYACRVCDKRHTPWPQAFQPYVVTARKAPKGKMKRAEQAANRGRSRRSLITQRLLMFLVSNWADGSTQPELSEATGLSQLQVANVLADADKLIPTELSPLPRAIGIDELYFRKKYHTVITDMSRKGETFLLDIVEGRPEVQSGVTPDKVVHSIYEDRRGKTPSESDSGGAALGAALEAFADQYAAHPDWRTVSGNQLLSPILTTDGWGAFKDTMTLAFARSAMNAGLQAGPSIFTADLFHLQRNLSKQAIQAEKVIKWAHQRALESGLDSAQTLFQNAVSQVKHVKGRQLYTELISGASDNPILAYSTHRQLLCGDEISLLEPTFRKMHAHLLEVFKPADFIPPESTAQWEDLLAQAHQAVKDVIRTELKESRKEAETLLNGVDQTDGQPLVHGIVNSAKRFHTSGEQRDLRTWMEAARKFDEHPLSRLPDGPFSLTQLDIALAGKNRDHHQRTVRRMSRAARMLQSSADVAIVEVLPVNLELVKQDHPDLAARAALLVEQFSKPIYTMVPNRKANKLVNQAEEVNLDLELAQLPALFNIYRPSNARTERMNRSIRRILASCSPTMPFEHIRTRLLCRLSGKLPAFNMIPATATTPVELPAPSSCPACSSSDLSVSSTDKHTARHLDVPIGWQPTRITTSTPRWTCKACQTNSTTVRGLQISPSLQEYLERIADSPRLVSASVSSWHRRTGAPKRLLSGLFSGPVDLYEPTPNDPAIVVGLSITSDSYRDHEEGRVPRVLIADLRHRPRQRNTKSNGKLLPARVISHEHMSLETVRKRLAELSEMAGQPLKLFLDNPIWGWKEWRETLTAESTAWHVVMDVNTALGIIRRHAHKTVEYWRDNTRVPVMKDERHEASTTDYSREAQVARSQAKTTMRDIFSKGLNREEDKKSKKLQLPEGMTIDDLYTLVDPPKDAITAADYDREDIIEFYRHLTAWWNILRNVPKQSLAEIRRSDGEFVRQYKYKPQMKASRMADIAKSFQDDLEQNLKYLTRSKPQPGDLTLPDTHTGDFHGAKLGPLRNRIKRENTHRGRAK